MNWTLIKFNFFTTLARLELMFDEADDLLEEYYLMHQLFGDDDD